MRVHSFMKHEEVEFLDLRSFNISEKSADELSRNLQTHFDIPDTIQRMEEIALTRKYFTPFLSQYVAEEYSIQEEYSFTAIALLHYINRKGVTVDEAVTELLKLSTCQSICVLCCSAGLNEEEREKIVKLHNYDVLKTLNYFESYSDEDISNSDDSTNDPPYLEKEDTESSSEETDEPMGGDASSQIQGFNPFDSSEDEESRTGTRKHDLNSTAFFNPFDDDDSESEQSKSTPKSVIMCEHCKSEFSNRNNMKQHLIRRVILFISHVPSIVSYTTILMQKPYSLLVTLL